MTSILVADTSVIINGNLAEQIESGSVRNCDIIIPQAVFDELQSQASNHKEQGFVGLEQIQKLNQLSKNYDLKITLKGSHPSIDDIKFAASGRIDALIIDIAKQNNATLYTSDNVQHLVAQAEDVQTIFLKPKTVYEYLEFLKFFDSTTMSCLLYTSPSPRDRQKSRMPSSA